MNIIVFSITTIASTLSLSLYLHWCRFCSSGVAVLSSTQSPFPLPSYLTSHYHYLQYRCFLLPNIVVALSPTWMMLLRFLIRKMSTVSAIVFIIKKIFITFLPSLHFTADWLNCCHAVVCFCFVLYLFWVSCDYPGVLVWTSSLSYFQYQNAYIWTNESFLRRSGITKPFGTERYEKYLYLRLVMGSLRCQIRVAPPKIPHTPKIIQKSANSNNSISRTNFVLQHSNRIIQQWYYNKTLTIITLSSFFITYNPPLSIQITKIM